MDKSQREILDAVVNALEHFWLRKQAAEHILEHYQIPRWRDLVDEYCRRPESKRLAEKRFAPARAVSRLAQFDSKALEELSRVLNPKDEQN